MHVSFDLNPFKSCFCLIHSLYLIDFGSEISMCSDEVVSLKLTIFVDLDLLTLHVRPKNRNPFCSTSGAPTVEVRLLQQGMGLHWVPSIPEANFDLFPKD